MTSMNDEMLKQIFEFNISSKSREKKNELIKRISAEFIERKS